jgi:hypothetical protein
MGSLLIHAMDTAWISSNGAVLQVSADPTVVEGPYTATNLYSAGPGALNATAEFQPGTPLDLTAFDELRFWIMAGRAAEGTSTAPFFLEFSYIDAGDAPGEEHRWFISVNSSNRWEQRRIGIANDRRSAVNRFRFRVIGAVPFTCWLSELLAVVEQLLEDVEGSLAALLDGQVALPGAIHVLLKAPVAAGTNQIVLPFTAAVRVGNRLSVNDGAGHVEIHNAATVAQDSVGGTTTVTFAAGEVTRAALAANVAFVSVIVPVIPEAPPAAAPAVTPAILLTLNDAREDLARSTQFTQRDSFRPRGTLTFASFRPAPRAYFVDYQITSVAPDRAQQAAIQRFVITHLSMDTGLRINGAQAPVEIREPPELFNRHTGVLAPLYVRIGTYFETAPRTEAPWVVRTDVEAGQMAGGVIITGSPTDQEGIVIDI